MDALNQLLKAAAEIRRRQVMRQQAQGGGGNGNRQTPDLSTLFDQELRKQQQTNYETPTSSETKGEEKKADDPLDAICASSRAGRRRSARQQHDLAQNRERLAEDELKRQLERLTREQNELRQQAEELAQQMQAVPSAGAGSRGRAARAPGPTARRCGSISEEMRNAASDLRRQDPQQASARGDRALQQLRNLERQMQGAAAGRTAPRDSAISSSRRASSRMRSAGWETRPRGPRRARPATMRGGGSGGAGAPGGARRSPRGSR